tara:strand:+ start:682 stop:1254 length:573 start_codon:yes stop_codon:yes gene_type:complete
MTTVLFYNGVLYADSRSQVANSTQDGSPTTYTDTFDYTTKVHAFDNVMWSGSGYISDIYDFVARYISEGSDLFLNHRSRKATRSGTSVVGVFKNNAVVALRAVAREGIINRIRYGNYHWSVEVFLKDYTEETGKWFALGTGKDYLNQALTDFHCSPELAMKHAVASDPGSGGTISKHFYNEEGNYVTQSI